MTVVVGHDGSDSGDDAAVLGAQLATSAGEDLVVVSVYPEENPIGAGRVDAEWVAYMREQAEEHSAEAQRFLAGTHGDASAWSARTPPRTGSTTWPRRRARR